MWRRWAQTGTRPGQLVAPGLVSDVTWSIQDGALSRPETLRFSIGADTRLAAAGDVLCFPPGTMHGATILDEEVVLIDIFTPIREDFLTT